MAINLSVPTVHDLKPRITVIGVGGAGGNAVNNMITGHLEGVEFLVANTDAQALSQSLTEKRIQLGVSITHGLGAGARPDIGKASAEEALEEIVDYLQGSNMVFIAAGMGGGTGTGAAPVIARSAREQGVLTVGVVTKPFHFEGATRMRIAEEGIRDLQQYVDTLIVIPNQNLFRVANEKTTFAEAFKMADNVLHLGVRGVTDLMVMPGLINLDFADVRTVMGEMGKAMMGTGEAEGEGRAIGAAEAAINNPLLDDVSMKGARGVLINICGGGDITLFEVDEAVNRIRDEVDPDANIIFGSTIDDSLAGRMRVSVVATGIDAQAAIEPEARYRGPRLVAVTTEPRGEEAKPEVKPAQGGPVEVTADLEQALAASEPTEPAEPVKVSAATAEPAPSAARAQAEPETVGVKAAAEASPRLGGAEEPFIPPRPVTVAKSREPLKSPEPFAAAAAANGAQEAKRESVAARPAPRGPSLFERMTGVGRARETKEAQAKQPEPKPQAEPRQGSFDKLQGGAQAKPGIEEDFLDIPAFLRRQAN